MWSLLREPTSSKFVQHCTALALIQTRSGSHIDLVGLDQAMNLNAQPSLNIASKHVLTSAHGEEVVRAITVDHQVRIVLLSSRNSWPWPSQELSSLLEKMDLLEHFDKHPNQRQWRAPRPRNPPRYDTSHIDEMEVDYVHEPDSGLTRWGWMDVEVMSDLSDRRAPSPPLEDSPCQLDHESWFLPEVSDMGS